MGFLGKEEDKDKGEEESQEERDGDEPERFQEGVFG
jgi:hypothetical protein